MDFKVLDDVVQVNDQECFVWAPAGETGSVFTGGSGGAAFGALRVAKTLPKDRSSRVSADTGMRYLSKVYSDEWMRERGYTDSECRSTAEDIVNANTRRQVRELIVAGPDQTVFHALHTADAGHFAVACVRRHTPVARFTRINSEPGAAGKTCAECHPRSDERAAAAVPCEAPVNRLTYLLSHEEPASLSRMGNGRFESSPSTT